MPAVPARSARTPSPETDRGGIDSVPRASRPATQRCRLRRACGDSASGRAPRFDPILGERRAGSDGGNRKGIAGDARGLEDRLVLVRQPLEPVFDELAHVQRNRRVIAATSTRGASARDTGRDCISSSTRLARNSGCPPVRRWSRSASASIPGGGTAPLPNEGAHRRPGRDSRERFRRSVAGAGARQSIAQRAPVEQDLLRSIGPEHEQARRITSTDYVASHSSVALSLQCRSSSTRISGSLPVRRSTASVSSRSMRSGRTGADGTAR